MSGTIYSLLVGINDYAGNVAPLRGCLGDIEAFDKYLRSHAINADDCQIATLTNSSATRNAIIDTFSAHLGQARPGDVALFVFSGHGSQEVAPPEFWEVEPDRLNETLVCYDSRTTGWDLTDKELAKLIRDVAERGAHVVVILDCCHSGSGTRGLQGETAVRFVSADSRERHEFLYTPGELQATREANGGRVGFFGKHVLLAACHSSQLAKEIQVDGESRGAFSWCLTDALEKAGGSLTYRELFTRVDGKLRASVADQSPQLELVEGVSAGDGFLGGNLQASRSTLCVSHRVGVGWILNAGAVHGIPKATSAETTEVALFDGEVLANELNLDAAVGTATVTDVLPAVSRVKIKLNNGEQPPEDKVWQAIVLSSPVLRIPVLIQGDDRGRQLAVQSLDTVSIESAPSLFVRECVEGEFPQLVLHCRSENEHDCYMIRRPADGAIENSRLLVEPVTGAGPAAAVKAVKRLESLARWSMTQSLECVTSSIPEELIRVELEVDGNVIDPFETETDGDDATSAATVGHGIQLEYRFDSATGEWKQPQFKLKITNLWNRRLYCSLVVLSDNFEITCNDLFSAGGEWLEPPDADGPKPVYALNGGPIYAKVPLVLHRDLGITEYNDYLKIIVSTQEFDSSPLIQRKLDLPRDPASQSTRSSVDASNSNSTLNLLLTQFGTGMRGLSGTPETIDDWRASGIRFTTVRPLENAPVPNSGNSVVIGPGIRIEPHADLRAGIRLQTIGQSTRSVESAGHPDVGTPRLLSDDLDTVQPFLFTPTRASDPGLSTIELLEIQNGESVTHAHPLAVQIEQKLGENECLLPWTYERLEDGTVMFLPVGYSEPTAEGHTRLVINALPPGNETDSRSVFGSARLFCSRVRSRMLGDRFSGYRLSAVKEFSNGELHWLSEESAIRDRVRSADRVLLFIHGIFGDTREMVKCAFSSAPSGTPAVGRDGDVILTFDYENLGTPVPEIARELKQRLAAVGLGPDHGKSLQVIAHSMGGLVSRWLIEREDGNRIVQHLAMLGTPNGGSPWPRIHDWALLTMGFGLNSLCSSIWPPLVLAGLQRLVRHDATLTDMTTGSEFLESLAASPDPGVPYTLFAGNTALPVQAISGGIDKVSSSLLGRLINTQTFKRLMRGSIDPLFFYQGNDLAVSVDSMKQIPAGRQNALSSLDVPSDHLCYFTNPTAMTSLREAIR